MTIEVHILKTTTGQIRTYHTDMEWYGDFIWSGGNYACDCNRALFFYRAGGEEPEWDAHKCGDGGYKVQIVAADGDILYDELPPPASG